MGVPVSQMATVASYVLKQKLRGVKRYPLVLMLEPLFRCNLACAGCGKIQYPVEILRRQLSPQECLGAVEECGAPIVSIPGGEPLLHPDIDVIVDGLIARRKFIYLCTNALLLEKHLHRFRPSKYLSFSVHVDGPREEHDEAVCRDGVYDLAVEAIRTAVSAGFRVTTNTTVFNNAHPERLRSMFDAMTELGVEGMMVSPGYPYEKAPDQEHFLHRDQTTALFRRMLVQPKPSWVFNQSPLFLEFLKGNWELECTPWGSPTYNIFGWQRPCYLLQEGYCETFAELLATTNWDAYGRRSGNEKCADCMVHCGYEPTAVAETFGSWRGFLEAARGAVFGPRTGTHQGDAGPLNLPIPPRELVELDLELGASQAAACSNSAVAPVPANEQHAQVSLPVGSSL
jgi:hopanoid biosynthesis associated radical SAM protein HpnH